MMLRQPHRTRFVDRLRTYTLYRRQFLAFFGMSVMLVLVSSILLTVFLNRVSVKEIAAASRRALERAESISLSLQRQIEALGAQLMSDPVIVKYMHATSLGPIDRYAVHRKLNFLKSAFPFVAYFGVYNAEIDHYYSTLFDCVGFDSDVVDFFRSSPAQTVSVIPRQITYEVPMAADPESLELVSFLLCATENQRSARSGFAVHVDAEQLGHMYFDEGDEEAFIITNASGDTVFSTAGHDSQLSTDLPRIASADTAVGPASTLQIDGKRYLFTLNQSGPWELTYAMATPYDALTRESRRVFLVLQLAVIAIFFAVVAVDILITNRLHQPLEL